MRRAQSKNVYLTGGSTVEWKFLSIILRYVTPNGLAVSLQKHQRKKSNAEGPSLIRRTTLHDKNKPGLEYVDPPNNQLIKSKIKPFCVD